jgi:hypothetical protein
MVRLFITKRRFYLKKLLANVFVRQLLGRMLRKVDPVLLCQLKKELRAFNSRRRRWDAPNVVKTIGGMVAEVTSVSGESENDE